MLARAIGVWFVLLLVAIANGALREALLVPRLGHSAAHAASTLLLSSAIALVAWSATPWIGPQSAGDAWTIGVLWVAATVAFEFLGGHFIFGRQWAELLADYNLAAGRIWILVLVVTLVAPVLAFTGRPTPETTTALDATQSQGRVS